MARKDKTDKGAYEPWLNKGDLLTVEEAADILRVSSKTVREWLGKRELIGLRAGKQWRIRRQDLEAFALKPKRTAQQHTLRSSPEEDQGSRTDT
jgi:excisionase family DNA binding protein